jgi:hypothetical protein
MRLFLENSSTVKTINSALSSVFSAFTDGIMFQNRVSILDQLMIVLTFSLFKMERLRSMRRLTFSKFD